MADIYTAWNNGFASVTETPSTRFNNVSQSVNHIFNEFIEKEKQLQPSWLERLHDT